MNKLKEISSSKLTIENSADTNRVFVWEYSSEPPFFKASDGWEIIGFGKAPWPKGDNQFAILLEKVKENGKYPSIKGEEMEIGSLIWHHFDKKILSRGYDLS